MKSKLVISFDIETAGHNMNKHSLLAIGIVCSVIKYNKKTKTYKTYKTSEYEFIDTLEIHFFPDHNNENYSFDESTKEFWEKNKDAFNILMTNRVSINDGIHKIVDFIKKYQQLSIDNDYTYQILTDNSWFDETWISHYISLYSDGYPLRHLYFEDKYMNVSNCIDLNQRIQGIKNDCNTNMIVHVPYTEHVPHDHTPVNDAKGLFQKYFYYLIETTKIRKLNKPNHKV